MSLFYEYAFSRIRNAYRGTTRDRFNLVSRHYEQIPFPKYTNKDLISLIEERTKEVGEKRISWSGGLDSTMICCSYINNNVPFSVICTPRSVSDCPKFYEFLKNRGTDILMKKDTSCFQEDNIMDGCLSDLLFLWEYKRFRDKCDKRFGTDASIVPEDVKGDLKDLASKKFSLDIKTDLEYFKFVRLVFGYTTCLYDMNIDSRNTKIISFFDAPEFTDLAYSSFYDEPQLKDDKKIYREYISDVTKDLSYMDYDVIHRKGYDPDNPHPLTREWCTPIVDACGLYNGKYKYIG